MGSSSNKILVLLLLTIIINYYTPVPYIGFDFTKRNNVLNKLYLAIFSAFIIVLTEVLINQEEFSNKILATWLLLLILGIIIFYYFIANQIFINEKDYLLTMKENHIMDLHITNSILKDNKLDSNGKKYGAKILANRTDEIKNIDQILSQ